MAWAQLAEEPFTLPEPEPLLPDPGKQGEYPVAALPPIAAHAVWATAKLAYVPASLAAQSVLAAISLAVQAHFNIQLPTKRIRPTSLSLVTVAESGDRKSTSDDRVMFAIKEYERLLEDEFARSRAEAVLRQSAWDEAKRELTARVKKQGREALEQAYRDLGPRPEGPIDPTIVVRTGTTQGLLKRFLTSRPSLGLMSDEGGSWLGGYGMTDDNRLATIATLSDFWDGTTVQMMTSGEGFTALRSKRLAFHMLLQPMIAEKLLGNEEARAQGILSRLLVSQPDSLAGTRIVDPLAPAAIEDYRAMDEFDERLGRVIAAPLPLKPDTNELEPRTLEMTADAKQLWWEFYNSIEVRLGPDGDLRAVKGFVGKLPEQAARIAACLAVFDRGVKVEHLERPDLGRAIVLAEFYLGEALRLFGHQTAAPIYREAQEVSNWLATKWTENFVTVTAVSRGGPTCVRNKSDQVRAIFELLVRHNHLAGPVDGADVSGKRVRQAWRVIVGRPHA